MATSGLNALKKTAKNEFLEDLQDMLTEAGYEYVDGAELDMKGTILIIRGIATGKGKCDLKLTITAPAKGTEY